MPFFSHLRKDLRLFAADVRHAVNACYVLGSLTACLGVGLVTAMFMHGLTEALVLIPAVLTMALGAYVFIVTGREAAS